MCHCTCMCEILKIVCGSGHFFFISIVCSTVLKLINQRVNFNEYCDFTQNFGQQSILTVKFFDLLICRFCMQKFNILTLHIFLYTDFQKLLQPLYNFHIEN